MNRPSRPLIRLDAGPSVPGAAVRLMLGGVAVGCCWIATAGAVPGALALLLGVAVAAVVRRPASLAPGVLVLVLGVVTVFTSSGIGASTFGLVLAVHLLLRLAALCAFVGWDTRVELVVLGDAALELLPAQLLVQTLTAAAAVLSTEHSSAGLLRWVAVGAALALALLVLPRGWLTGRS